MTQCIVDIFKVIQIQKQQCEHRFIAIRFLDLKFQTILEQIPVGQAGQLIIISLRQDYFVFFILLGDIRKLCNMAVNTAIRMTNNMNTEHLA